MNTLTDYVFPTASQLLFTNPEAAQHAGCVALCVGPVGGGEGWGLGAGLLCPGLLGARPQHVYTKKVLKPEDPEGRIVVTFFDLARAFV